MNHPALAFSTLAIASTLAAQTVSATVTALAPLTAQCTSGSQSSGNSLPTGLLSPGYNATASIGPVSAPQQVAMVDGFMINTERQVQITATNFLSGNSAGVGQSCSASQDLLVQLSATSAAPVQLTVSPRFELSAGVPTPLLELDVGNDGLVEWIGMFGATNLGNFVLGAQPLPIRMRLVSNLPIPPVSFGLQSTAAISLYVSPDNQVVTTLNVVGCAGLGSMEPPAPVFDGRGVDLLTNPAVFVLGFGTQPVLLGPQSPLPFLSACLLLPTPDVLAWELDGQLRLALPTALRPVTLYAQAVLVGSTFALSDGYRIYAY